MEQEKAWLREELEAQKWEIEAEAQAAEDEDEPDDEEEHKDPALEKQKWIEK